jgi:hypothetical protein
MGDTIGEGIGETIGDTIGDTLGDADLQGDCAAQITYAFCVEATVSALLVVVAGVVGVWPLKARVA